jgi:uncharacterized protein (TIGR03437 family)
VRPRGTDSLKPFTSSSLTSTELANAIAFTKLLGYVQYFHPSDQAQNVNWDDFAINGMSQALNASSPAALASILQNLFQPIAPTVRVYLTGQQPPLPAALQPAQTSGLSVTQMYHFGAPGYGSGAYLNERVTEPLVNGALPTTFPDPLLNINFESISGGLPAGWSTGSTAVAPDTYQFTMDSQTTYNHAPTLRIQYSGTSTTEFADATLSIDATSLQGQTIQISGAICTQQVNGYADIFLKAFTPAGSVFEDLFNSNSSGPPQGTTGWQTYQVTMQVPSNATSIWIGLVLSGSGTAWFSGLNLPVAGTPFPVVNPASPYIADLGGGVSSFVPLALYVNSQGTLPGAPAPSIPSMSPYSVSDEATRLAGVAEMWNIMQHFEPYFNVVPDNWPAALNQSLAAAATAPDEPTYFSTLRTMAGKLHDGHATFLQRLPWETDYLPPIAWDWVEGQLVVTYVQDSQGQQIAAGDIVVSIDGVPVPQALAQAESLVSGATRQWIRYWAVSNYIGAGDYDSTITLVLNSGGQQRSVSLTRTVNNGTVIPVQEPRPAEVAQLAPGIMYVDLNRVNDTEWDDNLSLFADAKGLIFDLRGYPNNIDWNRIFEHLTQQTLQSERFLVPINVAPDQTQRYLDETGEWTIAPAAPFFPAKVVFLTDGRAISQAETDMGFVEYYHLGEIVGGPTAGTNGNITQFNIIENYVAIFTGMVVLKQDGSQHHGVGIQPTIPVMRTLAGVKAGTDEVLARALALLQNPGNRPVGPWVASAADGLPDTASPGSLISVTVSPSLIGLPPAGFSGASVAFDGHPAPVLTSPDTIVTVLPSAVAGQSSSQMTVQENGQTVFSFGVQVSPTAPALFSPDNTGRGTGLILNADGTFNSPSNPAPAGSNVILLTTGLGMTSPDTVSVMIGGHAAQAAPATSALADPQASFFSVQATIPPATPSGPASVFILAGGVPSQGGLQVNVR